jgi:lipopolysaccharide transport system ATP-binding protein
MHGFRDQDPILSVRGVGVTYRRPSLLGRRSSYAALHDVSFDLFHGESLAVIGRNGAGKSTLLKLLGGILRPDIGHIRGSHGLRVALLARQVGFDADLSGRDNIVLSALLLGFSRAEIRRQMDDIIDFAELGAQIDQPLSTYSVGMRARLGFAVSSRLEPDVLLIDEAMGVGDAAFQAKSTKLIEERLSSDKTVVLVTHSAQAVRRLCNRAVWLDQGVTRLEGSVDTVLAAYGAAHPVPPMQAKTALSPDHRADSRPVRSGGEGAA